MTDEPTTMPSGRAVQAYAVALLFVLGAGPAVELVRGPSNNSGFDNALTIALGNINQSLTELKASVAEGNKTNALLTQRIGNQETIYALRVDPELRRLADEVEKLKAARGQP